VSTDPTNPTPSPTAPPGLRSYATTTVLNLKDSGTAFISKLRWKALGWVLAALLAGVTTVTFIGGGWVAALSIALAAAAVSVNRLASTLDTSRCMTCGEKMPASASPDVYGISCGACGAINDRVPRSNDVRPTEQTLVDALAERPEAAEFAAPDTSRLS
jgi:hypothetical protein